MSDSSNFEDVMVIAGSVSEEAINRESVEEEKQPINDNSSSSSFDANYRGKEGDFSALVHKSQKKNAGLKKKA